MNIVFVPFDSVQQSSESPADDRIFRGGCSYTFHSVVEWSVRDLVSDPLY